MILFEETLYQDAKDGTPLVEIGDPADLEVVVEMLSRDGAAIPAGTRAELERLVGKGAIDRRGLDRRGFGGAEFRLWPVDRTIFGNAARKWLAGSINDAQAVEDMAARYQSLCAIWDAARQKAVSAKGGKA